MSDFRTTVLQHIQCSHAALDAANVALTKTAEQRKQADSLIPAVVDALIKHDRIEPGQREKAAEMLKDPINVQASGPRHADRAGENRRVDPLAVYGRADV